MGEGHPRASMAAAIFGVVAALATPTRVAFAVGKPAGVTRSFEVTASKFRFEPDTIEVDEGDRVAITLHSADVTHGFALKPFDVKAAIPKGGQPVTVEFVADKAGTYEFRCAVYCGPRHRGMRGRLVVRPRVQ